MFPIVSLHDCETKIIRNQIKKSINIYSKKLLIMIFLKYFNIYKHFILNYKFCNSISKKCNFVNWNLKFFLKITINDNR